MISYILQRWFDILSFSPNLIFEPTETNNMKTRPSSKKDWLILPVHNHPTLKRSTRKKLLKWKILLLGDLVKNCINKKKEFVPVTLTGFGVVSNYDIAGLLHRTGFLSGQAFTKVQLPEYRYRKLTDKEIGDMRKVLISKFPWSPTAKLILIHTSRIGCRRYTRNEDMQWKHLTVGDVVKRFVRITSSGKTTFWHTGHFGSWHYYWMLLNTFQEAVPEIQKFLYDNYFLEKPTTPEQE